MALSGYIIRRLLLVIPTLIGITLVTFAVSRLVPIDPMVVIVGEKALDNPEIIATANRKWGLDRPVHEQYLLYVWNLLHGNMGVSFTTRRPVLEDLAHHLPATAELGIASMLFALIFGLALGIGAALKAGTWVDFLARLISLVSASMPPFWSGLLGLFLLYYVLHIFPGPGRIAMHAVAPPKITGLYTVDTLLQFDPEGFVDVLHHLILPSIVLGSYPLALISRTTRSSLLEALRMKYIIVARAKGLRERKVIVLHALRNAFIPILTTIGLSFVKLMAGAIMTETVFAWPGIGRYGVEAAANLDYPAVMGVTLLIAVLYILGNLVVDILYTIIDPRIRRG